MKDNFQNIYDIDGNNIFGCFTYNTCRGELKARELLLYTVKVDDILSNFKEYTSKHIINIDGGGYRRKLKNYASLLLNRITGFNSASLWGRLLWV